MLIEKVALDWLFALSIAAMLLLALRLLLRLSGGRKPQRTVWGLHGDQRGSVQSLSFVLTLPLFIMIIMAIVQIGQIMMAQVVVEYAALASARAASVWTPTYTTLEGESEQQRNCLGDRRELIEKDQAAARYRITTSAKTYTKVGQIQKAAHMACLPICPSRWPYPGEPTFADPESEEAQKVIAKAYLQMAGEHSSASEQAVSDRVKKKYAYSEKNTHVEIEIEHPSNEPPFHPPSTGQTLYDYAYQANPAYMFPKNRGGQRVDNAPL